MGKLFFVIIFIPFFFMPAYPASCYGTKIPRQGMFFAGEETYIVFQRHLEKEEGELNSRQNFFLLSYGIYDRLCLDLKAGAGNIKQHPLGRDEVDYPSAFAGGYGLRLKLYERDKAGVVLGFQHISVHPKKIHLQDTKHIAILDDWQFSFLLSYAFSKVNPVRERRPLTGRCANGGIKPPLAYRYTPPTSSVAFSNGVNPYLGAKWSRVDYIHRAEEDRKRNMSDLTKSLGFVFGADIPCAEKLWVNIEGHFFDEEAVSLALNWQF